MEQRTGPLPLWLSFSGEGSLKWRRDSGEKKEVGAGVHLMLLVFSATSRQVCVCVAGDKRDR